MSEKIILIVDDDKVTCNTLYKDLCRFFPNHTIMLANNGADALEIVHNIMNSDDILQVVVSDYKMPIMNGDELLIEIHKILPKTVTIMTTALTEVYKEVLNTLNKGNLYRYISKPFNLDSINFTISSAITIYEQDDLLEKQNKELKYLNENLEKLVEERTNELKKKNEELAKLSITDTLTGLHNRLYLDKSIAKEISESKRHNRNLSVIMLDIDFFKKVNDMYGHSKGDEALIAVSSAIRNNVRQSDIAGRWGGEEFLVICSETDLAGVKILAENLRVAIEKLEIDGIPSITASFGIAQFLDSDSGDTTLFMRADNALYKAKASGRNCVKIC